VNFKSPSAYFSSYVIEELQDCFINNKRLIVIERSGLELLRKESEFQMSGEVSDENAISAGHFLGAEVVITGGLTDIDGVFRCHFNVIDIGTAARQVSPAVTVQRDNTAAFMLSAAALPGQVPERPDPDLVAAYFNAGFAHYEAGRYPEAVVEFIHPLEIKDDDETSLDYRGWAYYYLKDYDQAIRDFSRLIRMHPDNAGYYGGWSNAYNGKGDYTRARAGWEKALQHDPNFSYARDSLEQLRAVRFVRLPGRTAFRLNGGSGGSETPRRGVAGQSPAVGGGGGP
jgi:tetratricopeptide (TPR) repeat protein